MRAIAINEDHNEEEDWARLADTSTRIVYALPDILLLSGRFKLLFRSPAFRYRPLSFIVDKAHVTQEWKDDFRKAYGELGTLKTIAGPDLPWAAVSICDNAHQSAQHSWKPVEVRISAFLGCRSRCRSTECTAVRTPNGVRTMLIRVSLCLSAE